VSPLDGSGRTLKVLPASRYVELGHPSMTFEFVRGTRPELLEAMLQNSIELLHGDRGAQITAMGLIESRHVGAFMRWNGRFRVISP
jgi:hypothetical protein